MGEIYLKASYLPMNRLIPFQCFNKGSALPFDISFALPFLPFNYQGGFGFTDDQRMAPSSWASILACSDSQESNEGNQRMRWGYRNSWKYFRTQGAGDSHGKTIPSSLCAWSQREWNGRIHCFHLGLQFWYFSRFSLFQNPIITMFLVNTSVKFPLIEGVIATSH